VNGLGYKWMNWIEWMANLDMRHKSVYCDTNEWCYNALVSGLIKERWVTGLRWMNEQGLDWVHWDMSEWTEILVTRQTWVNGLNPGRTEKLVDGLGNEWIDWDMNERTETWMNGLGREWMDWEMSGLRHYRSPLLSLLSVVDVVPAVSLSL